MKDFYWDFVAAQQSEAKFSVFLSPLMLQISFPFSRETAGPLPETRGGQ